jgi:NAD-dependent deacetylase
MDDALLQQAAQWLRAAREIMVFTGAGMSAESGIPTFRDDSGLWQTFPPERFATWQGLLDTAARDPRKLAEFLHAVIGPIARAEPNAAHRTIAAAEQHVGIKVVTQNVDGLHQEAGSTCVYEIHGSFFEIVTRQRKFLTLVSRAELRNVAKRLQRAAQGRLALPRVLWAMRPLAGVGARGVYQPHLVLFGDALAEPAWTQALATARACDAVLQIGCSAAVWPAAGLPSEARAHGARVIAIDPQPSAGDVWLKGAATDVVPRLFDAAFGAGHGT